jgi:hypothetical protein
VLWELGFGVLGVFLANCCDFVIELFTELGGGGVAKTIIIAK